MLGRQGLLPVPAQPWKTPTETGICGATRNVRIAVDVRLARGRAGRGRDNDQGVAMTNPAVVIVGGGPTGLMLAGELALAAVDVVILERRASQELTGLRAGGLHARTIELFDQRGIADRFLAQGRIAQVAAFAGVALDI